MKTTVSTIKISSLIAAVCVLLSIPLSYLQSNCGNWGWLWGNSVTMGVLASAFVVLAVEMTSYLQLKHDTEKNIYLNVLFIYLKLKTILYLINKAEKTQQILTSQFLQPQAIAIQQCNERLKCEVDKYQTLCDTGVSKYIYSQRQLIPSQIDGILMAIQEVELAITEDVLDVYKSNMSVPNQYKSGQIEHYLEQRPYITASSPNTSKALQKVIDLTNDELFDSMEMLLHEISKCKGNKFDWARDKEHVVALVQI